MSEPNITLLQAVHYLIWCTYKDHSGLKELSNIMVVTPHSHVTRCKFIMVLNEERRTMVQKQFHAALQAWCGSTMQCSIAFLLPGKRTFINSENKNQLHVLYQDHKCNTYICHNHLTTLYLISSNSDYILKKEYSSVKNHGL